MRYTIILITAIAFSFTLNANSQTLDEKNGFNKFQLGTYLKDVKKIAKLSKSSFKDGNNIERYLVKDIENYKLFGYGLGRIQLIFYKDQLLEIIVQLRSLDFSSANMSIKDDISENIENQYGKFVIYPLSSRDKANEVLRIEKIIGSKLELHRHVYGLKRTGDFSSVIIGDSYSFISIPISEQIRKEDDNGL